MRRFAAQYIITATGDILKRGIITTTDSGKIVDIEDSKGELRERSSTPFYNGIIVPGFVNCHSHIELSDMLGVADRGSGLGHFIKDVREKRNPSEDKALLAIEAADKDIYRTGTSAVADISNTTLSFPVKDKSPVQYINLLEVFGSDPAGAEKRFAEIVSLKEEADRFDTPSFIVPHAVYSISRPLFEKIAAQIIDNSITSIHFLESEEERQLIENLSGPIMDTYNELGIKKEMLSQRAPDHITSINSFLPANGNLILVHNTVVSEAEIALLNKRKDTYWCLCPNSNLYIEDRLPPVLDLINQNATIVLGTDSLASNKTLNLLDELITLQESFPTIGLADMVKWATKNGARALNMPDLGTIEVGKSPGLVLIENCDLNKLRLTPASRSVRLI